MRRIAPVAALVLGLLSAFSLGCRAQTPAETPRPKDQFRQLVMTERKPAPSDPKILSQTEVGTAKVERVRIGIEDGHHAVAVIYRPKAEAAGEKFPAVIVQHFLGGHKDHFALILLMGQLAQKGYVVAAIDGRYRGERQNGKSLEAAMVEALKSGKGHPFLIDTVFDVTRLVDYLQTRPDVRKDRIGMTGFSEGGIVTWMTAAIDERIHTAVPIIGVTSFADAFEEADGPDTPARLRLFAPVLKEFAPLVGEKEPNAKVLRTALMRLVPGLVDRFDAPNLLPEIAPRPLLILNHEKDELFPIEGAKRVHAAAQARYRELKAEDRLDFRIAPGLRHSDFSLPEATSMAEWMDRWLKPAS